MKAVSCLVKRVRIYDNLKTHLSDKEGMNNNTINSIDRIILRIYFAAILYPFIEVTAPIYSPNASI